MHTKLSMPEAHEMEIAKEIEDAINNHKDTIAKHTGTVPEFRIMDRWGDNKRPEIRFLNQHTQSMCRAEAERAYESSPKGVQLKKLNDAENACYQVLHSGYDITDARAFIDKVFAEVGINSPVVTDISNGLGWDGCK